MVEERQMEEEEPVQVHEMRENLAFCFPFRQLEKRIEEKTKKKI